MLVFFTNFIIKEFQVIYLALFLLFSVKGGFRWLWMNKNIQLKLEFMQSPFLVLHLSSYTLMIFQMMLSVILLSMLMIPLTTLNVIRHLICGNNFNWILNFNLICKTLDWGRKLLVDFSAGKTQLVLFDWFNNTGAVNVKVDGSVLEEKLLFKMLGSTFSSKLDCGSYIFSIAKTASKKIGALICSIKSLSPDIVMYLYKSTIRSCIECCCHAPSCYWGLLGKLQILTNIIC